MEISGELCLETGTAWGGEGRVWARVGRGDPANTRSHVRSLEEASLGIAEALGYNAGHRTSGHVHPGRGRRDR